MIYMFELLNISFQVRLANLIIKGTPWLEIFVVFGNPAGQRLLELPRFKPDTQIPSLMP